MEVTLPSTIGPTRVGQPKELSTLDLDPSFLFVCKRLSKIWVTTITRSVEKILAANKMLKPPTTLVPKFAGIQQLFKHVCHDVGISYSFASY